MRGLIYFDWALWANRWFSIGQNPDLDLDVKLQFYNTRARVQGFDSIPKAAASIYATGTKHRTLELHYQTWEAAEAEAVELALKEGILGRTGRTFGSAASPTLRLMLITTITTTTATTMVMVVIELGNPLPLKTLHSMSITRSFISSVSVYADL